MHAKVPLPVPCASSKLPHHPSGMVCTKTVIIAHRTFGIGARIIHK